MYQITVSSKVYGISFSPCSLFSRMETTLTESQQSHSETHILKIFVMASVGYKLYQIGITLGMIISRLLLFEVVKKNIIFNWCVYV